MSDPLYAANAVPFVFTMGATFLFGYAVFTHRKAVSIQLVGFNFQNLKLKVLLFFQTGELC